MHLILATLLVIGLALQPIPAQAREPLRLPPATPWVVDYADDSCRLARNFGSGNRRVTLIMDQFEPGDVFLISLAGKPTELVRQTRPAQAKIRFGPHEAEAEVTMTVGKMDDQPALLLDGDLRLAPMTEQEKEAFAEGWRSGRRYTAAPIGEAREAAATWLQLNSWLKRDLLLETGSMAKPLAALRTCSWDMVRHWGLDVEQQRTLSRRPYAKRGPATWLRTEDYPKEMLTGGHQGNVHFRLMIDATGKATSCHIQQSTRPKEFDDAVCDAVIRRAEFEPALDARGRPVPSYWRQSVIFRICC